MSEATKLPEPLPALGEMVLYRLSQKAVQQINRDRQSGIGVRGNLIKPGDTFAMMCTAHNVDGSINGQVFLDGNDHFWAVMCTYGPDPGQWSRRPVAAEAIAAKLEADREEILAKNGSKNTRRGAEAVRIDPGRAAA